MTLHLVPRSLQYLEQVAQHGSIQAASRELGISASAIHRQITAIEDTLGEMLFERDPKGMILTPSGRMIMDLAREWRLDNARLLSAVQANRGIEYGHIRIAAMDGMVNGLLPDLVNETARHFPRVEVEIEITSPDNAVKGVQNGDFDFAVVVNPAPGDELVFHWSREFPLGCIAAPDHPVAKIEDISLREIISNPVVFQSRALSIRKMLEARHNWIFERAANSIVVNSIQLMKHLVVSGSCIAITSELDAGPEIRSGQLRFIPISDTDVFRQKFAVVSNAQIPESSTSQKIISITVQILRNLNQSTAPKD
jgi:molybdate transport repressor ModE-like protein